MKILMVLEHEFPSDSRVEKEAISLIKEGHEVHLACYSRDQNFTEEEIYKGIHIHRKYISVFTYKSSIGCLTFPFYFNFWRHFIHRLMKNHHFDAIHIHDLPLAQPGIEFKNKYNIFFILDLHENYPASLEVAQHTNTFPGNLFFSSKQWRNYEASVTKKADKIITVVKEMKDRIIKQGVSPDDIIVVENTPDIGLPLPAFSQPDKVNIRLVYVGGLNIHRGLQVVIQGLPSVIKKYPSLILDIYGDGRYRKTLEKLSVDCHIENHVVFHGKIRQEEVLPVISKANIALLPHLKSEQTDNSSPNKLYQYFLLEKYILASNCNSISRMITESQCGTIYKHNSPEDFALKLTEIMDQKKHLSPCPKGKTLIFKKYNWDVSAKNLTGAYKTLK